MTVCRTLSRLLSVAFIALITVFIADTAFAQDYKESYNAALEAAKGKDYPTAITLFNTAAAGAAAEGDTEVERRSNGYISKMVYSLGLSQLNADAFDAALAHFDNGIAKDPAYPKNYLARASALKRKGDIEAAIPAFAEAASRADAAGDSKTGRQATQAIRDHYIFIASSALSRNGSRTSSADADEALDALTMLQNFVTEDDADIMYYFAEVHKVKGEYADAVSMADQALALHRGSRTDKAKIFYVKGEALVALGNVSGAKEAFAGAAFGSYKASAEHYIETLGTNN
jgi:tetratricopeptide (TPR) repeat protein